MTAIAGATAGRVRALGVLWRFGRPHTLVGTAVAIGGLAAIAVAEAPAGAVPAWWDVLATLVAGLAVNVAITGVNQITDVEIDRVNKPYLPIAAGELSLAAAWWIVGVATVLPLAMAVTQGVVETAAVAAALLVGAAYSLPPVRLKRHPAAASACITGVRSVLVNLGVAAHLGGGTIASAVWALTLFVLPFSFAIAVLKDVPDREGDQRFAIRTFTVRAGPRRVFALGLGALAVAYGGMLLVAPFALADEASPLVLVAGHLVALAVLAHWARTAAPEDEAAFTRFYLRVWLLFFLEYLIVPFACVVT